MNDNNSLHGFNKVHKHNLLDCFVGAHEAQSVKENSTSGSDIQRCPSCQYTKFVAILLNHTEKIHCSLSPTH